MKNAKVLAKSAFFPFHSSLVAHFDPVGMG